MTSTTTSTAIIPLIHSGSKRKEDPSSKEIATSILDFLIKKVEALVLSRSLVRNMQFAGKGLEDLTYDRFSKMTPEEANRIMHSNQCFISLGNKDSCYWHNWRFGGKGKSVAAFHFSVSHTSECMSRAFAIIFPQFLKIKNSFFKIVYKDGLTSVADDPNSRNAFGKEFIFFLKKESLFNGDVRHLVMGSGNLIRIVKMLKEASISPGKYPIGDVPVKGGEGYLFFRPFDNLFQTYTDAMDLVKWDFTRRESVSLDQVLFMPPTERTLFSEDPWSKKNCQTDWSQPCFYIYDSLRKMIEGCREEEMENRLFAKWFAMLLTAGLNIDIYVKKAMSLRAKALDQLRLKDQDYPLACLMSAVYYDFVFPVYIKFFLGQKRQIHLKTPLIDYPLFEKRLIVSMAAASLREKGVQYLVDDPLFIKPFRNKFQKNKELCDWLAVLLNPKA